MSLQMSLPGLDASSAATDRVLFAIIPDTETARRVAQLARRLRDDHGLTGRPLATDRFHVTLNHLGDYAGLPRDIVTKAALAGAMVAMSPFDAEFDRAGNFASRVGKSPVVLRGDAGADGLVGFQKTLGVSMAKAGLGKWVESHFTPHMTLLYDGKRVDDLAVEPIRWTVREFVLIHSLLGQTKHIVLGRWPLRA